MLAPRMDFDIVSPLIYSGTRQCGFSRNIINIPSIINWNILEQKTLKYNDSITATFNEGDQDSKKIVIKGLSNYILQLYDGSDIRSGSKFRKKNRSIN